jgi:hypothetical protein
MRVKAILVLSCAMILPLHISAGYKQASVNSSIYQQLNLRPLNFTENIGQWDESVRFRANAGSATVWFFNDGICYHFIRRVDESDNPVCAPGSGNQGSGGRQAIMDFMDGVASGDPVDVLSTKPQSIDHMVIRTSFVGANQDPDVRGHDVTEYYCNYFIGNDPNRWFTDVPNYECVMYDDVYPGIDLKYYSEGNRLEYDFVVSPFGDPTQIEIVYEGAESISVNEAGEMVVKTEWNTVTELAPHVYQNTPSGRADIACRYYVTGDNTFGFILDGEYDPSLPLTIDPVLIYSTYLGGSSEDVPRGIAVDGNGSAYVSGYTYSVDFPTENPYQTDLFTTDIFVTKFSASGNSLVYSTYLSGSDEEWGGDVAVDESGHAYVTGYTYSTDFPTYNPFQSTNQDQWDAFVTKLSSTGNSLIYSTYLGGLGPDEGYGIAVDEQGNAYVVGLTVSPDFPTENPYQTNQGESDVFVTKFSSTGTSLVYSTYLGGGSGDWAQDIAVDGDGNAVVTGYTVSVDFPTENPYQIFQGADDVFVTKLASSGSSLVYSTYLGGTLWDHAYAVAVDIDGNAYVTGETESADFPTVNPFQATYVGADAFVTKLSSTGVPIYSTFLGGEHNDHGYGIAVDSSGSAFVVGSTASHGFPLEDPYQSEMHYDYYEAFITRFSESGDGLIFSTYFGGPDVDNGYEIAIDDSNNAYIAGNTYSYGFPLENPYQDWQGHLDVFVAKFSPYHSYLCGDADGSKEVDIDDAVLLILYVFAGGQAPEPYGSGDADCSGAVDIDDAVWLMSYIFAGGNAPGDIDGDGEPDC